MKPTTSYVRLLLLLVCLLSPAYAQIQVTFDVKKGLIFEVTPAKPGTTSWKLAYGFDPDSLNKQSNRKFFAFHAKDGTDWLVNSTWLRRVDAKTGDVKSRWHLPGLIIAVEDGPSGHLIATCTTQYYRL